jgi:hypothetical protein
VGEHGFPHQKEKCTEPVSPSSGNPTDLRRSDCHSESHQPWALRTRCKQHTMGIVHSRQGRVGRACPQFAKFSFHTVQTAHAGTCSSRSQERKGPGTRARPQEFAEPGTLSSTFPTNRPLPRSAPRGASSYRRPVLGAAALYANPDASSKGPVEGNARKLRSRVVREEAQRARSAPPLGTSARSDFRVSGIRSCAKP